MTSNQTPDQTPITWPTPSDAPRTLLGLVNLGRFSLRRLAQDLGAVATDEANMTFMGKPTDQQASVVLRGLLAWDQANPGAAVAAQATTTSALTEERNMNNNDTGHLALTPQVAPRNIEGLVSVGRFNLRQLAQDLEALPNDWENFSFMHSFMRLATREQAARVLQLLRRYDENGGLVVRSLGGDAAQSPSGTEHHYVVQREEDRAALVRLVQRAEGRLLAKFPQLAAMDLCVDLTEDAPIKIERGDGVGEAEYLLCFFSEADGDPRFKTNYVVYRTHDGRIEHVDCGEVVEEDGQGFPGWPDPLLAHVVERLEAYEVAVERAIREALETERRERGRCMPGRHELDPWTLEANSREGFPNELIAVCSQCGACALISVVWDEGGT